MSIDSFDSDEFSSSIEQSQDQQEKQKEYSRKIQAQLRKIQKDEKRAQGDNQKLFLILSRFIQDVYYQSLVQDVSFLISLGFPSRGVLSFIGLFYPDAAYYILDVLGKKYLMNMLLDLPRYDEKIFFDEKIVDEKIHSWLTEWIRFMEQFLLLPEASLIMTKKVVAILSGGERKMIERSLSSFLVFFFASRNIEMSVEKGQEYARFICGNLLKVLSSFLDSQEGILQELLKDSTLSADDFFGS